jgi:hypothetical protein
MESWATMSAMDWMLSKGLGKVIFVWEMVDRRAGVP